MSRQIDAPDVAIWAVLADFPNQARRRDVIRCDGLGVQTGGVGAAARRFQTFRGS